MSVNRADAPIIRANFPLSLVGGARENYFAPMWEQLYAARFANFGNTATIIGMGDSQDVDDLSDTTFNTRVFHANGSSQIVTWATAPNGLVTPFSLTPAGQITSAGLHGPCGIPGIVLAGASAEYLSLPDAAYWTSALAAFSVGAWVIVNNTATTKTMMAKYTANQEEWQFAIMSDEVVRLIIVDTTAGVNVRRDSDAAISTGVAHHVFATYDGAANADGIVIYVDGVAVASTATNNVNFVTMRNNTSTVTFGATDSATPGSFYNGSIFGAPLGLIFMQVQATAAQVLNDYRLGRAALGL